MTTKAVEISRTRVSRIKFCSDSCFIYLCLRLLMSLKSFKLGTHILVLSGNFVLRTLTSEKIHRPKSELSPRTLVPETRLPRYYPGRPQVLIILETCGITENRTLDFIVLSQTHNIGPVMWTLLKSDIIIFYRTSKYVFRCKNT